MAKKRKRQKKNRMEFSQKLVVLSWAITVLWITFSYALSWMNLNPNETVTVALVTESFGVTISYFAYQAVLKTSRNKTGVDRNGIPYKVKERLDTAGILTDEDQEV